MLVIELITVLPTIFLGARLGEIGTGSVGGLGVSVLAATGVKPGNIPFDAIPAIMAAIATISAMQAAGGLDYLVHQIEGLLRRNPKHITIFASIVTYFLAISIDTGNILLAILPVVAGVAKEQGVKPCHPLSTAVVFARIAITASPISATVVYMPSVMEGHGVSYLHLPSMAIPSTLLAVLVISFLVTVLLSPRPSDDSIHRKRPKEGLVELCGEKQIEIKSNAKTSVWLFLLGVVSVVIYAIINSPSMGLVEKLLMNTIDTILIIMLSVATPTTVICRVDTDNILNSSTLKAGMSACICTLGVVWLGDTFVSSNADWVKGTVDEVIQGRPWLLAVIFFFVSALLYSQTATTRALMPMTLALNVSPLTAVASFATISGLFTLLTYPTLVATVQTDDMGATYIDKFAFNCPLFIPDTLGVVPAVYFSFVLGSLML